MLREPLDGAGKRSSGNVGTGGQVRTSARNSEVFPLSRESAA